MVYYCRSDSFRGKECHNRNCLLLADNGSFLLLDVAVGTCIIPPYSFEPRSQAPVFWFLVPLCVICIGTKNKKLKRGRVLKLMTENIFCFKDAYFCYSDHEETTTVDLYR